MSNPVKPHILKGEKKEYREDKFFSRPKDKSNRIIDVVMPQRTSTLKKRSQEIQCLRVCTMVVFQKQYHVYL